MSEVDKEKIELKEQVRIICQDYEKVRRDFQAYLRSGLTPSYVKDDDDD